MADRNRRFAALAVTAVLVGLNLAALNYLLAGWSTARIDLTQDGMFSISPATERLLTSLDETVTIYGYFSERTHPKLAPLVPELRDLLEEYRAVSGGKIQVEIVDPGGNEEAEQEATSRFGVRSTPFRMASKYESGVVNAYFAIVVRYADQYVRYGFDDLIRIDPAPDGDVDVRLRSPEYDLTRAIKKVVYGFRSTNDLFDRIEQPARLTAIWTPDSLPGLLAGTPDAVRDAVGQLETSAAGKLVFDEIDPSKDEAVRQDVYRRYGARPLALGLFGDTEFYLYAVLQVGDRIEQLPLTGDVTSASVREAIENALRRNTPGFLKTVGVVTPDPPDIPAEIRMQMQLPPTPPPEFEEVKRFLREEYEVADVSLDDRAGVPTDVDILVVLKPVALSEKQLYGLDQYLMRGGRVVICTARYDVDFSAESLELHPVDTGLDDWLEHLGLSVGQTLVLDDRNQPLPIPEVRQTPFGLIRTWSLEPYPYLVEVRDDGFLKPEITASLDSVGIYWGSPVQVDEDSLGDSGVKVIPILQSSDRSWTSDDLSSVTEVQYVVPAEGTEPHLLAVALAGKFRSYFAGKPAPWNQPADGDEPEPDEPAPDAPSLTLEESPETRLVVIGNAQFLSDLVARTLGRVEGGFFLENLRFAQNLIDWTTLDNDMLEIRSRGAVSRRLERIDRGREVVVETANYLVPLALLGVFGMHRYWRRKHTVPLTDDTGLRGSAPRHAGKEVG